MVFVATMWVGTQVGCVAAVLVVAACGSGTTSPSAPPPPAPALPDAVDETPIEPGSSATGARPTTPGHGGASTTADGDVPTAGELPATEEASPPSKPIGPPPMPHELLTVSGIAFLLDDPSSDLKQKLTEECERRATEQDPAEIARCRQEEREKFAADVFVFKRQPEGGIQWIVYQRVGSTLNEVHIARVEMLDETPAGFRLRSLTGQGARPVFKGQADISVSMPSKHELVLQDARYGKLVYRAKFGLVGN